jgi:spore germination protein KC
MKMRRRICLRCAVLILVIAMFPALLSGCYDRRELDTLGIVMGVALDSEGKDKTKMTVQMVKVSAQGGSKKSSKDGGGGGEEDAYINASGTGKNANVIVREMQDKMSRKVYVAHSEVIVFGEELAKNGVRDSLDFFARAPESRMTLYIFVAKGKGEDVLKVKPEFEKLPSTELRSILTSEKLTSDAPIVTEFEFVGKMVSKSTAAVAPLVAPVKDGEKQRLNVEGAAVFKESKMVGDFGKDETKGLLLAIGKFKTGIMNVEALGTSASVEIRSAKSKIKPELKKDGSVKVTVEIEEIVGLGDQTGTVNLSEAENSGALYEAAKHETEKFIWRAVDKSRELNADVFGFGESVGRKYPKEWKELEKKWGEKYKDIEVEIVVKVKGDGNGRLNAPLIPSKD